MTSMMRVDQIWSYPVKSMVGGTVPSAELSMLGIVGDRRWAVRDLRRGGIRGAKQLGGLMTLVARDVAGGSGDVEVMFPDGRRLSTTASSDLDDALSTHLDHPVRLESLRPSDDLDHYRRGAPANDDMMVELRSIFGREESEPLPDFSVFPPEVMEFESPPGTYHDCWPLMICVMVTREVADLPADRAILRHIVRDLDQNVGVYARIVEPGPIAVGDSFTFV
ncbi:MAG: hypothetical protein EBY07_06180 [Actinobacteria bacterium]|nr:hypothetical protein [Actinomycetota bacterium]